MLDPQKLLDQFLGTGRRPDDRQGKLTEAIPESLKGFGGGVAVGGLAGILLGSKGGRKLAKDAVKIGGLAVLGGLAYKAYRDWQAAKGGSSTVSRQEAEAAGRGMKDVTPAAGTPFLPAPPAARDALGLKLLRAMIAAAKADGHIDAAEQARIFARLGELSLSAEEKAFLMDELARPLDVDAIVSLAETPGQAVEIYAASCIAIDPDDAAEQGYLAMLASRLKLDPGLKAQIETEAGKLLA